MHTSTRLVATDFQFWQHGPAGVRLTDFASFCPDYHELDRIGVVSPELQDGVYHTSYALLALTTAFYDSLRARSDDFFDYPQHFAFVGAQGTNLCTSSGLLSLDTPKLWHAWSWLDVWPENKWVTAPATASAMLQRVFDYQINRLFWPWGLRPGANEPTLPTYVWKMLQTRLKAVYYYLDTDQIQTSPKNKQIELRTSLTVNAIVQESLELLPETAKITQPAHSSQYYQRVRIEDFLAKMSNLED